MEAISGDLDLDRDLSLFADGRFESFLGVPNVLTESKICLTASDTVQSKTLQPGPETVIIGGHICTLTQLGYH